MISEATGAVAETKFHDDNGNDLLTHVSKAIYDDQGTQKIITGKQWLDGSGRVVRAGTGTGDAPDSYDMTATVYDRWGRVVKQSNPYLGDADGNPQAGVNSACGAFDSMANLIPGRSENGKGYSHKRTISH